jgi:hypothetical protein
MVRLYLHAQMVLAAAPRYGHCRHQAMLRYENFRDNLVSDRSTRKKDDLPREDSLPCNRPIVFGKTEDRLSLVMHTAETHADWWLESCLSAVEILPCCDPWRTHVASDFSCLAARWRERYCWFSEGQRQRQQASC